MGKGPKAGYRSRRSVRKPYLVSCIEYVGGHAELAKLLDISSERITNWIYTDVRVPIKFAEEIEKKTKGKFKRNKLRPKE